MKVQTESFQLKGNIIGFRPQTQKLESPYKTPSNSLAVKGLRLETRTSRLPFPLKREQHNEKTARDFTKVDFKGDKIFHLTFTNTPFYRLWA